MKNLRSRLDRLEQCGNKGGKKIFKLEWLYPGFPAEQLDDETREMIESLFVPRRAPIDPVEFAIANLTSVPSEPPTSSVVGSYTA